MFRRLQPTLAVLTLCAVAATGRAADPAADPDRLLPEDAELAGLLPQTPMPRLADSRLGKILTRYYHEGLGGPDDWDRIESLRVSGTLELPTGEFAFEAYQKKPDLIKMTVRGNQRDLLLGYDGETAWQSVPGQAGAARPMPAKEARRFIHSARFGSRLLYPFAPGKSIEYVDTVPVEGTICHQVRVHLDTGYQVDYFIDVRSYFEIKVVNTDLRTGLVNAVTYEDYIREFGMPIARKVRSEENGEWVSSLTLDQVKVNAGLMPWMFAMPRPDDLP